MAPEDSDLVGREDVGFDPATGAYRLRHDGTDAPSTSYTLLKGVSAITGVEPANLEPLTDIVDPDALDDLFGPASDGAADVRLTVRYNGCDVAIYSDGHLLIRPPPE